jgi:RHS repeat-associated protein
MKSSFGNISFTSSDFFCPALLPPSGRVTGEKSEHKTFSAKTQSFMIFNPPFRGAWEGGNEGQRLKIGDQQFQETFTGSDFLCPALLPSSGQVPGGKSEQNTSCAKTQSSMIFNPPFRGVWEGGNEGQRFKIGDQQFQETYTGSDFLCPALKGGKSEQNTSCAKTQSSMIFNPPFRAGARLKIGCSSLSATYPLTLYTKRYELTDWLGNVRVVITNKKIPLQSAPLRYRPDVVSVTDYYAFGSEVRERTYEKLNYDYSFNGKEKDDEVFSISGTFQNYGMRMYDTRIARFISEDPISFNYPWYTPYQFAGNKPIQFIDLDGLEEADPNNKNAKKAEVYISFTEKIKKANQYKFQIYPPVIPKETRIAQGSYQCYVACTLIVLENAGFNKEYTFGYGGHKSNIWFATGEKNDNKKGKDHEVYIDENKANNAIKLFLKQLKENKPSALGVDYKDDNYNHDHVTDHFVVGVGTGKDSKGEYIIFYDVLNVQTIDQAVAGKLYNKGSGYWEGEAPGTSTMYYKLTVVRPLIKK